MDARTLAGASVLDVNGSPLVLGERWKRKTAVVVWLRHYGCLFCREQAAAMRKVKTEIEALGAELVFVGNGEPAMAADFQARHAPDCTVLTDPDLRTYKLIGARHGIFNTIGPASWGAGLRALRRGARQSRVQGHPFQQGGVLVIAPGNRVLFAHISKAAGDHPTPSAVLDALRAALPARASA